jgi:hypothetical protein
MAILQAPNQPQNQTQNNTIGFNDLQQNRKQGGSGYTNIQRLVSANQQNKLGSTIGGGIQQSGQQVQQGLNQGQQQFKQQTQQEVGRITPEVQNLTQNVLGGDVAKAATTDQGKQFTNLLQGQYSGGLYRGPQGLQNAQQLQSQAQDVSQQAQAIGSAQGRQGLLQRYVGSPTYGAGQQRLDTLLLGQTGAPQLAQARKGALGLMTQANTQISGAQAQAQEAQNKFNQALQQGTEAARNQLSGMATGLTGQLSQRAQEATEQEQKNYQSLLDAAKTGQLTQQQADLLGVKQGDILYNLFKDKPESLIGQGMQATAQNIATPEEYARIQALQQLSGGKATADANTALQNYLSAAKPTDAFDPTKFATTNTGQIQSQLQNAAQMYNTASGQTLQAHDAEVNNNREAAMSVFQNNAFTGNPEISKIMQQYGISPGSSTNVENVQNAVNATNASISNQLTGLQNGTTPVLNAYGQVVSPNDLSYQDAKNNMIYNLQQAKQQLSRAEITNLSNAVAARNSALQDVYNQYGAGQVVQILPQGQTS